MREIIIDASRLTERESAQTYLKEELGFPEWYGRNLDALHDMLGEMDRTKVIFENPGAFEEKYGYPKRVLKVFQDAAEENPGLAIETK